MVGAFQQTVRPVPLKISKLIDSLQYAAQLAPELEAGVDDEEPDDDPDWDPDEAGFSLEAGLLSVVLFVSPLPDSVDEPEPLDLDA